MASDTQKNIMQNHALCEMGSGGSDMKAYCLFEQSGTFKNEFKKLGIDAYDYDIRNDFGQTDFVVDIFAEIQKAYEGWESIFDQMVGGRCDYGIFPVHTI